MLVEPPCIKARLEAGRADRCPCRRPKPPPWPSQAQHPKEAKLDASLDTGCVCSQRRGACPEHARPWHRALVNLPALRAPILHVWIAAHTRIDKSSDHPPPPRPPGAPAERYIGLWGLGGKDDDRRTAPGAPRATGWARDRRRDSRALLSRAQVVQMTGRAHEGSWFAQSPSAWIQCERSTQQLNFRVRAAAFPDAWRHGSI